LTEAWHTDTRVVLGNDADIVLDDALAQVFPALKGLCVLGGVGFDVEDVGGAKIGGVVGGEIGPVHNFGGGEEAEELLFAGEFGVAGVRFNAVEEVGLFVVVGGEEDEPAYALEGLGYVN
jgi:hypothetical protein